MKTLHSEKIKTTGDIPSPRFGHTFTMVSSSKAVLFGGAVSQASTAYAIQINSSSRMKAISTILWHLSGQSSTLSMTSYPPKEQLTLQ